MTDDAWQVSVDAAALQDAPGPVLDAARLDELAYTMSPEELREFVWLSIVDTEMRLTDIASYRAAGNLEGMAEVARRVAREAASLGALHVHILALRLETACRTGKKAGICSLLGELSEAWSQVGDRMCAWLAEQASPRV
jgi:HPt (histidine-containing phosphotransfer) domain-containing protein